MYFELSVTEEPFSRCLASRHISLVRALCVSPIKMAASYRRALLDKYGIAVQEQWVANVLQAATNNAASATVIEALLYRSFLMADLNQCGTATLPRTSIDRSIPDGSIGY